MNAITLHPLQINARISLNPYTRTTRKRFIWGIDDCRFAKYFDSVTVDIVAASLNSDNGVVLIVARIATDYVLIYVYSFFHGGSSFSLCKERLGIITGMVKLFYLLTLFL